MARELHFTGPRLAREGLCFDGYSAERVYHFLLLREAARTPGARRAQDRHLLPDFERLRLRIYEAAEHLAERLADVPEDATIVIGREALQSRPRQP